MSEEIGIPTIKAEVMLLNWQVSASAGAKLILAIDESELEPFKSLTRKEGKRPGQRLMAVFVPIGPDELPITVEHVARPPLFTLAAQWCRDPRFMTWLATLWPAIAQEEIDDNSEGGDWNHQVVSAAIVKRICGIASRKELDTNPEAAKTFNLEIRGPFSEYLKCQSTS